MEKKNTVLLTVIAVATLLVAVIGATFAYFTATGSINAQSKVDVTTSTVDSVSGGATSCTLAVTGSDMRQQDGTPDGNAKAQTSDCTLTINGNKDAGNTQATKCTYDIVYTPTAEGTEATGGKTYSTIPRSAANTENKKELSIAGKAAVAALGEGVTLEGDDVVLENNTYAETDMYTLNSQKTIVEKATYTFKKSSSVTWTFTIKMYNYDFDQNDFANKTFGGTLAIENISCTAA